MATRTLELVFSGDDRDLSRTFKGVDKDTSRASKRMARHFKSAAKAATVALAGIGAAGAALAVNMARDLVSTSLELRNLTEISNASAEQLQILGRIAERSGGSAEDVADAYREMQLRLSELASVGTGPAADALQIIGVQLSDLQGLAADEQFDRLRDAIAGVEDPALRLFAAEELLGGSAERLNAVLNPAAGEFDALAGSVAAASGVISGDAVDAIARIRDRIDLLKGRSLASLGDALVKLEKPILDAVDWFDKSLRPAIGRVFVAITKDVIPATAKLAKALSKHVKADFAAASDAGQHLALTMAYVAEALWHGDTAEAVDSLTWGLRDMWVAMEQSSPTIRDILLPALREIAPVIETMLSTGWGRLIDAAVWLWERIGDDVTPTLEHLADVLAGPVNEAFEKVSGVVERVGGWLSSLDWRTMASDAQTSAADASTAVGGLGDKTVWLRDTFAAVRDFIGNAWSRITEAFSTGAGDSNRFVTQIVDLWRDHLLPALQAVYDFLVDVLVPILRTHVLPVLEAIFGQIGNVIESTFTIAVEVISVALDTIRSLFRVFAALFTGEWGEAWDALKDMFVNLFGSLAVIFGELWEIFSGAAGVAFEAFRAVFGVFADALSSIWSSIWGGISDAFSAAWDGIKAASLSAVNYIIGLYEAIPNAFIGGMNAMIRAWNDFSIGIDPVRVLGVTVVPGFTWSTPNLPTIPTVSLPRLAEGGIVTRPTVALIGEDGPEAVLPLGRRGRMGGQVIELNVNVSPDVPILSDFDFADQVIETIQLAIDDGTLRFGT